MRNDLEGPFHPRLINYTPKNLKPAEWARFRDPVCSLVTRAKPRGDDHAKSLVSKLCQLLTFGLIEQPEASFADLFTLLTVTRHINGLKEGHSKGFVTNSAASLQRLLSIHQDLQPKNERRRERDFATVVTDEEILELRSHIYQSPPDVGAVLGRCLLIGLASGFGGRHASKANICNAVNGEVEIEMGGRTRAALKSYIPELLEMRIQDQNTQYIDSSLAKLWWQRNIGKWPKTEIYRHWALNVITTLPVGSKSFLEARLRREDIDPVMPSVVINLVEHRHLLRGS
jgi:hypothetical protein